MPLVFLVVVLVLVLAVVGSLKLWADMVRVRSELDGLRDRQDALMEMVSNKLLEDDALSREILRLKTGPPNDG